MDNLPGILPYFIYGTLAGFGLSALVGFFGRWIGGLMNMFK